MDISDERDGLYWASATQICDDDNFEVELWAFVENNVMGMATILKVWHSIKNLSQYVITWRTILPNVIPIRFEMMQP